MSLDLTEGKCERRANVLAARRWGNASIETSIIDLHRAGGRTAVSVKRVTVITTILSQIDPISTYFNTFTTTNSVIFLTLALPVDRVSFELIDGVIEQTLKHAIPDIGGYTPRQLNTSSIYTDTFQTFTGVVQRFRVIERCIARYALKNYGRNINASRNISAEARDKTETWLALAAGEPSHWSWRIALSAAGNGLRTQQTRTARNNIPAITLGAVEISSTENVLDWAVGDPTFSSHKLVLPTRAKSRQTLRAYYCSPGLIASVATADYIRTGQTVPIDGTKTTITERAGKVGGVEGHLCGAVNYPATASDHLVGSTAEETLSWICAVLAAWKGTATGNAIAAVTRVGICIEGVDADIADIFSRALETVVDEGAVVDITKTDIVFRRKTKP